VRRVIAWSSFSVTSFVTDGKEPGSSLVPIGRYRPLSDSPGAIQNRRLRSLAARQGMPAEQTCATLTRTQAWSEQLMPLSIIGAGLGRTGTTSLKLALETLGFAPCHHMLELIFNPESVAPWVRAATGEAMDWDEVLAGYRATTDWPACHFYKELAARYPRAQVILTVRDARRWYESTQATIFSDEVLKSDEDRPMSEFLRTALVPFFGGDLHDRERMVAAYERHNAEVRRTVAAERLLVYELAEGWEPLCRFLGVPIPDQPFPRSNSTEDFLRMVRADEAGTSTRSAASDP